MRDIGHEGILVAKQGEIGQVELQGNLDCEGCNVQGRCGLVDGKVKQIEGILSDQEIEVGTRVRVELTDIVAIKALTWSYIFPFIILFISLVILLQFFSELYAGLMALTLVGLYYIIVYLTGHYFEKNIRISIKELSNG